MSIRGARLSAAQLARRISVHHQGCTVCQRGGRVVLAPGGARRVRCDIDRRLFELLGLAAEEGWPDDRLCGPEQPHEKPAGTESAGSGHPYPLLAEDWANQKKLQDLALPPGGWPDAS